MIMGQLLYNNSARMVKYIASKYLEKQKIQFKLDDDLSRLYRLLTLYFTNNPEFETYSIEVTGKGKIPYSLHKGNLLIGPPGRSKTFCYESVFKSFTKNYNPSERYRIISIFDIQLAFEEFGTKALRHFRNGANHNSPENMYIDEIGAELLTIQHFGNKINPIQLLLQDRYKLFVNNGIKTHASTNLLFNGDNNNLKIFYGDRVYSRIFEMFNIITTKGDDLRITII